MIEDTLEAMMNKEYLGAIPEEILQSLLQDAFQRDRTTARRVTLLNILLKERFLARICLMARVEDRLGRGCFGDASWKDTFYRDMRVVKEAFQSAGYELAYSRSKGQSGYYLRGQPRLDTEIIQVIAGSVAEVDPQQIAISSRLGPANRFRQGCSISDTALRVVAYRLKQRRPELSSAEANRLVLEQSR
jgi:hypothetical protein